jgi:hypothetical protein
MYRVGVDYIAQESRTHANSGARLTSPMKRGEETMSGRWKVEGLFYWGSSHNPACRRRRKGLPATMVTHTN